MSDIARGDLVMVVRWPCCGYSIGAVGQVTEMMRSSLRCGRCGLLTFGGAQVLCARFGDVDGRPCWSPAEWLKKIDPPAESSDLPASEPITVEAR